MKKISMIALVAAAVSSTAAAYAKSTMMEMKSDSVEEETIISAWVEDMAGIPGNTKLDIYAKANGTNHRHRNRNPYLANDFKV
ncbi:MAG: hypothetical protein MRQ09_02010 [Candidatus Midichloria sp.]|nr:hypothetical protein [Candidatus Midichloria sp.]